TPTTQGPSKDPAGIFDGKGNFDSNAYLNMAKKYGTSAMIAERFGNSWSSYHSTLSAATVWQGPSKTYTDAKTTHQSFFYSRGTPCAKDDYSTNYAQVVYITDASVALSAPGVDGIATLQRDHCLWSGQPQSYCAVVNGHP